MIEIELRLFDAEGSEYNPNEPVNKMWHEDEFFKHFKHYMPYKQYGTRWRIMQFTGLIDNNNKKIFEEDILKFIYDNKIRIEPIFKSGGSYYIGRSHNFIAYNFNGCDESPIKIFEVIGNTYENPELITW